jgi:acetolactate synthase-1/2/3 large subunit
VAEKPSFLIKSDEQRVIHVNFEPAVREYMPKDGIGTLDSGRYKIWFARNYPAYQSNTLLLDNALASMGAGL